MLTIPHIINAQYVIEPLGRAHNKSQRSGMIAAPILIDGQMYICCLTLLRNTSKKILPYALTLKNELGKIVQEEKVNTADNGP